LRKEYCIGSNGCIYVKTFWSEPTKRRKIKIWNETATLQGDFRRGGNNLNLRFLKKVEKNISTF